MASFIHPVGSPHSIPLRGTDAWNLEHSDGTLNARGILSFTKNRIYKSGAPVTLQDALDAWSPHADPQERESIAAIYGKPVDELMAFMSTAFPARTVQPEQAVTHELPALEPHQELALRTSAGDLRRDTLLTLFFGRQIEGSLPATSVPRSADDFASEWAALPRDFDAYDLRANVKNRLEADLNPDADKYPGAVRAFLNGDLEFVHPELLVPVARQARRELPPYLEETQAVRVDGADWAPKDIYQRLEWAHRGAGGEDRPGNEIWKDKSDAHAKEARAAVAKTLNLTQKQLQSLLDGNADGSIPPHKLVTVRRAKPGVQVGLNTPEGPLSAADVLRHTVGLEMYGVWKQSAPVGHQWPEEHNWTPEDALASWLDEAEHHRPEQEWLARTFGLERQDVIHLLKGEYQHFPPDLVTVLHDEPPFQVKPNLRYRARLAGSGSIDLRDFAGVDAARLFGGPRPSVEPRVHPNIVKNEAGGYHYPNPATVVDPMQGVQEARPGAVSPSSTPGASAPARSRPSPIDAREAAPAPAAANPLDGLEGTFSDTPTARPPSEAPTGHATATTRSRAEELSEYLARSAKAASEADIMTPGFRSPAMEFLARREGNDALKQLLQDALEWRRANIARARQGLPEQHKTWNAIIEGPPGSGKSTGAELVVRGLHELGILKSPAYKIAFRDDLIDKHQGATSGKVSGVLEELEDGALIVDEAHNIVGAAENDQGPEAFGAIMKAAEDPAQRTSRAIFLLTYPGAHATKVKSYDDAMAERFPVAIKLPAFTEEQLQKILVSDVANRGLTMDEDAISRAMNTIRLRMPTKTWRNAGSVRNIVDAATLALSRREGAAAAKDGDNYARLNQLRATDFDLPDDDGTKLHQASKDEVMERGYRTQAQRKLASMVGMEDASEYLAEMLRTRRRNFELARLGEPLEKPTLHVALSGPTGAGKTTKAQLILDGLYELGFLSNPRLKRVTRKDLVAGYVGQTEIKTQKVLDETNGGGLFVDEIHRLIEDGEGAGTSYGNIAAAMIMDAAEEERGSRVVFISTYDGPQMDRALDFDDGMRGRFAHQMSCPAFSDDQLRGVLRFQAGERGKTLTPEAEEEFMRRLKMLKTLPNFSNGRAVRNLLDTVSKNAALRTDDRIGDPTLTKEDLQTIQAEDIWRDFSKESLETDLGGDLVGLEKPLQTLWDYEAIIGQARRDGVDPREVLSPYFLFAGSPGTGKTTVANRLGRIFQQTEYLPSDRVVKKSYEDICQRGSPAENMRKALESAQGATFFLDEFYRFCETGAGREALHTLMEHMENHRGELAIALAGYKERLPDLAAINPGFAGRFDNLVEFPDLSPAGALEVAGNMAAQKSFAVSPAAERVLPGFISQLERTPGYANARTMRQLVNKAVAAALLRRAATGEQAEPALQPEDLEAAASSLLRASALLYGTDQTVSWDQSPSLRPRRAVSKSRSLRS